MMGDYVLHLNPLFGNACAVSFKVKTFAWLAVNDKILTRVNLLKKGRHGLFHCEICGYQEESIIHIFFHCAALQAIWNYFLRNASSHLSNITLAQIFTLKHYLIFQLCNTGWNTLVLAIFWCLWLHRIEVIFRNKR